MKPRTKQQVRVMALSSELPKLNEQLTPWAFENCIDHIGYRTKSNTSCLSCGHVFKGDATAKTDQCPGCARKLNIEQTRKKKVSQRLFFAVIDVKADFQVSRFFEIYCHHRAGEAPRFFIWEIVQQWMLPNGKYEIVARCNNYYSNRYNGDLEIRGKVRDIYNRNRYDLYPDKIYPKTKCLPIYKRNGFTGKFGDLSPYQMFSNILVNNKAETLLKANQFKLLSAAVERPSSIEKHWKSIKICIRNNYTVKDAKMWLDYLDLLNYLGKDMRSAYYVCPVNLKKEHDKMVFKKAEIEKRLKYEQQKAKIEEHQIDYEAAKSAYFGIEFKNGDLTIKVLEHVREFFEEGELHKHCVYTNEYYAKPNSLLFSARFNNKPVETIELSLSEMKILQSRGLSNRASEYNKQIVELLNKNLRVIKKVYSSTQTVAA